MAKYEVDFFPGEDDRLPEWVVVRNDSVMNGVKIGTIIFRSHSMATGQEEAETICEEANIAFQAAEWELANNQLCEFDGE